MANWYGATHQSILVYRVAEKSGRQNLHKSFTTLAKAQAECKAQAYNSISTFWICDQETGLNWEWDYILQDFVQVVINTSDALEFLDY